MSSISGGQEGTLSVIGVCVRVCVCVWCVCVTMCHFTGFFLFSLRLLPKFFRIFPVNVIIMVIDLACAL